MPKRTACKQEKSVQVHVVHLILDTKEFAAGPKGMVVNLFRGRVVCLEKLSHSAGILASIYLSGMRR
jgi:hypothetical protein